MNTASVLTLLRANIFQTFKYSVYTLLAINIFIFFREEWLAANHTYAAGVPLEQLIEAFSATIDTTAWVLLLLLFELETYILSDEKIKGTVKWFLHGVRGFCYLFIVYAFFGYVVHCMFHYNVGVINIDNLCRLADGAMSYLVDLDEYLVIDTSNCSSFPLTAEMFQFNNLNIVTDSRNLLAAQRLAWVDVINAATWILVVIVLEIDVHLHLKGLLRGSMLRLSKMFKVVLYSILLIAAVYWGFKGDFVDFWDAFLWLVAFAFIESNIFDWQAETKEKKSIGA